MVEIIMNWKGGTVDRAFNNSFKILTIIER